MVYLGVDIGSVSVKLAWLSPDGTLLRHQYHRHLGHPLEVTRQLLEAVVADDEPIANIAFTGSGGKAVAEALGAPFDNEIICQARAAGKLMPEVNTLIVVGGEDSFLLLLERSADGEVAIRDFAMNGLCAAGCGSFLDQQASRLGVQIIDEFGKFAVESENPARVAGRCSVFAKTDMIHLQQKATPVRDIVAGLCFAFARNFIAVLARGKEFVPPVAFCGGVALNAGMVRAFTETLGLQPEQFIVPEHAPTNGAIGAAFLARAGQRVEPLTLAPFLAYLQEKPQAGPAQPPLPDPGTPPGSTVYDLPAGQRVDAYLGVDIGSISTNVVLIDEQKRVLAKQYLMTAGRPIEAVRQGLTAVGEQYADKVNIRGVCTTGSGRYLVADFIGADVVKNEITAQARAAAEIDPLVDTIFEIGGQDSKYIALENGAIVDFEMNKVCAAGTGSFLEEQAERLGVNIKGEFSAKALSATAPVRLGERCTVFMESDLVGQQARGASTEDLAAGLAYSTVHNYLNRVVAGRKVGERIFFQGGTAFNQSVVAAFRAVTGKPVQVPEHHEVTGAIGCALIAREEAHADVPSRFKGVGVANREYTQDSFECKSCANRCTINRVTLDGEATLFYGSRCEKFEKKRVDCSHIPDYFAERERLLMADYQEEPAPAGKPLIGIPRTLHFSEYAPFWLAFFRNLGFGVRFSSPTSKTTIHAGLEVVNAEYCFPVKVAHGHVMELLHSGVSHLFLPNVQHLPKLHPGYQESVPCPFVQSFPYTVRAAIDPESQGITVLAPVIEFNDGAQDRTLKRLLDELQGLGVNRKQVQQAYAAGQAAQSRFSEAIAARGREVLANLPPDGRAMVIVSRPYNGCDNGINLEIPTRFRELGVLPIPMDMLPTETVDLSGEFPDLTWRYGQKILATAELVRQDPRLHAVYITNFGCGPDSFLLRFFRAKMGEKPFLQLEIDEHSSDVGAITRREAFLDSVRKGRQTSDGWIFRVNSMDTETHRTIYVPKMCDVAHAIAAAFRAVGQPSEVLPEATGESVALGKRHCTGKECFPCIVTTGDFAQLLARPEIDPAKVAFFMPSVAGGCRFGYYNLLQRLVLDELGHTDIPIFSPNQSRGLYDALGAKAGDRFVRRAWQGIAGIELLEKALHFVRPAEVEPGSTDRVYQQHLQNVCAAIESGDDLLPSMRAARAAFEAIPMRDVDLPWVGVLGEVFVRAHAYSNQYLVRNLEALGARVWMAPITEWIYYVNINQQEDAHQDGKLIELMKLKLTDKVMKDDEHHLAKAWEGFIPNLHEAPPEEAIADGSRYIDPAFRGEAILGLGKAHQFHRIGLAGVINVMPFTCMPGIITSGIFKRFQQEHEGMPVISISFEGQECGDLPLRLEAFLQQCHSYLNRRKAGERELVGV